MSDATANTIEMVGNDLPFFKNVSGVQDGLETVKRAVDAGRQAAEDARGDLEKKLETSKAAYRAGVDAARDTVGAGVEEPEAEE